MAYNGREQGQKPKTIGKVVKKYTHHVVTAWPPTCNAFLHQPKRVKCKKVK